MRTALISLLVICVLSLGGYSLASAPMPDQSPRIALVIANGAYSHPNDVLGGPLRDAQTMKVALERVGFNVIVKTNLSKAEFQQAIKAFHQDIRKAGPTAVAIFYYAGHGAAALDKDGNYDNFLIPIDVPNIAHADLATQGLSVRSITELLQNLDERRAITLIIDACRTPAGTSGTKERGGSRMERTLVAPPEPQSGYLIAHSTSEGKPASDAGEYAATLSKLITTPGLTLPQVFDKVRLAIATNNEKQRPMHWHSLLTELCLAGCEGQIKVDQVAVLRQATEMGAAGDLGQVAAVSQLVREGKSLAGLDLTAVYLQGAILDGADFTGAELIATDLGKAKLAKANFSKSFLPFAQLKNVHAAGAIMKEALLYFARAEDADFTEISGQQSNWQAATLRGAVFRDADLRGASFLMADLRGADFTGADLRGAFFIGTLIDGAKFDRALIENSDFSSAIGSANQFSHEQKVGLCGTSSDEHNLYKYKLVRVTPSTRFPSGKDFQDILTAGSLLRSGLRTLDPCARRKLVSAGNAPIWTWGEAEYLGGNFRIDFPAGVLDKAGRVRELVKHAESTISTLRENAEKGNVVTVIGKRHQEILNELNRNVNKVKFEGNSRLDGEDLFLYQVRYQPQTISESTWRYWAESYALPAQGKSEGRWPRFFPPEIHPTQVSLQHIEVFKRWTFNRARVFPTQVSVYLGEADSLTKALQKKMWSNDGDSSPYFIVFPLVEYATHRAIEIESVISKYPQLKSYESFVLYGSTVAIRLPKTLENYKVQVQRTLGPVIGNERPNIEVLFKVQGVDILQAGDEQLIVLDVDLVEVRLHFYNNISVP